MRWQIKQQTDVLTTHPFTVQALDYVHADTNQPLAHPYYRIKAADWVNILPITSDGQAVLIRQPRPGTNSIVLETPGGVIDPHEKDATMAAARELEEETGYCSQRILSLGAMNPNPAIMTNRLHMFVALGCYLNPRRQHFPDASEEIEVVTVPAKSLAQMVRIGEIDNCLAGFCIMLAAKYVQVSE